MLACTPTRVLRASFVDLAVPDAPAPPREAQGVSWRGLANTARCGRVPWHQWRKVNTGCAGLYPYTGPQSRCWTLSPARTCEAQGGELPWRLYVTDVVHIPMETGPTLISNPHRGGRRQHSTMTPGGPFPAAFPLPFVHGPGFPPWAESCGLRARWKAKWCICRPGGVVVGFQCRSCEAEEPGHG